MSVAEVSGFDDGRQGWATVRVVTDGGSLRLGSGDGPRVDGDADAHDLVWDETAPTRADQQGEVNRLRAECAALANALGDPAVTHDWIPQHPHSACCGECGAPAHYPVHCTPAVVRSRLAAESG